jgi:hypothetical protein
MPVFKTGAFNRSATPPEGDAIDIAGRQYSHARRRSCAFAGAADGDGGGLPARRGPKPLDSRIAPQGEVAEWLKALAC